MKTLAKAQVGWGNTDMGLDLLYSGRMWLDLLYSGRVGYTDMGLDLLYSGRMGKH